MKRRHIGSARFVVSQRRLKAIVLIAFSFYVVVPVLANDAVDEDVSATLRRAANNQKPFTGIFEGQMTYTRSDGPAFSQSKVEAERAEYEIALRARGIDLLEGGVRDQLLAESGEEKINPNDPKVQAAVDEAVFEAVKMDRLRRYFSNASVIEEGKVRVLVAGGGCILRQVVRSRFERNSIPAEPESIGTSRVFSSTPTKYMSYVEGSKSADVWRGFDLPAHPKRSADPRASSLDIGELDEAGRLPSAVANEKLKIEVVEKGPTSMHVVVHDDMANAIEMWLSLADDLRVVHMRIYTSGSLSVERWFSNWVQTDNSGRYPLAQTWSFYRSTLDPVSAEVLKAQPEKLVSIIANPELQVISRRSTMTFDLSKVEIGAKVDCVDCGINLPSGTVVTDHRDEEVRQYIAN